jgi:hypothetical protein
MRPSSILSVWKPAFALTVLVALAAAAPRAPPQASYPELGIAFGMPGDWSGQAQEGAVLLTSTRYKGFILIQSHEYTSLGQMAADAAQGIVDGEAGLWLMPVAEFQPVGENGMSAEFAGMAQGVPSRAFAIGLIGPRGGGVTVMAAVETGAWSDAYPGFVQAIAGSLTFGAAHGPAAADGPATAARTPAPSAAGRTDTSLMQYLAGEWYSYSSGTTIYGSAGTERTMTLCPDGFFRDSSEFGASGTGEWGVASAGGGQARWSIQGDRTQGTITVTYGDGRSRRFGYRVGSKQEQTISFDGITYAFAGTPRCP